MIVRTVILFIWGLMFYNCSSFDGIQRVKIDDKYAVDLPAFLTPTTELNDNASLQYSNGLKEFYVIIIDENKESIINAVNDTRLAEFYDTSLDGYSQFMLRSYCESIKVNKISNLENISINGLNARKVNMNGNVDGVDVYMEITYIEGQLNYYQLMTWTLLHNKENHLNNMQKMTYSFREI